MPLIRRALLWPLLLAPSLALAQAAPAPAAAPSSGFAGLFTSWSGTSRESLRAESEIARRVAPGAVPASSEQPRSHGQAAALGERVGDVVRRGDCREGERIAREAGDFALVRAVRDYCRASATSPS